MSFTSNSWKQSGGLNRSKKNQNIKANQMAPSNLNITEKLGVENSTTPSVSHLESSPSTFLYNFQNGQNFNNNIAYYPFNKPINNTGISNESLNPLSYIPSNFDLNYRGSGTSSSLSLVSSPFNQNATQFSQNAKTLISDICYNTQNIFGTDPGNSVSYAITVSSYIYISSDASNFCFFGMDNFNQDALTNNGNITTGISNESFYLWYPDNDGKATIYYTTISPASDQPYGFSSQVDIVLKDKWHALTLTLNGNYVYINQNGNTVFKQPVSVGTKVPNQPIAINLSSKSYDSTTNTVITNGSTNSGNIQLLDYNIFNFSADPSTVQQISDFRDKIQNTNNSNIPNRNLYLNYTIGEDINYLSSKIIAGNGIGNNGSLTNFGEFNNFSTANFYDKTTFYGPVQFDSSASIIYDSSINSSLEIYTLPGKAGSVTSSFLIENAGGVPGNSFNPTMVVYNGTSGQINGRHLPTQGLVFSISGENVSVGDIFGTHTFDVSGSSYLHGNLTINDTQNGGYGSYPTSTTGTMVLRHSNGDDTTNYNGSTGIVFRGPKENGNDCGAIGYIDNIGKTNQSLPSSTIPASYNYYNLDGEENSCLYISSQNDGTGGSGASVVDSLVLRSSGYLILDTGNYNISNSSDYPNSSNRLSSPTAPGPISILPNGGSVGIGKLNPNTDYTLDMCGNLLLCAKGSGAGQQPTLTLQYDTSPYTYISSSSITDPTSSFSGQLTFQAGSFNFNNKVTIGKSNPTTGYVLDVSGNSLITGSLDISGNKINITNSTFNSAISMGYLAGNSNQNQYSIAIGASAGYQDQSANSIAIGYNAGQTNLGQNSIAIGYNTVNQFNTSVALGAGATTTANNQIVLGTTNETVYIPGILDASLQEINVLGNITLGGSINYSDGTTQNSAYTGAATKAGSYNAANITIDSNGKITNISSGSSGPSQTVFDSQTVNFNNFRQTNKIKSITYDNNTTIRDSLIKTNMNGRSSKGETTVTFGTGIEPRWVAVGSGTHTIATSPDGITWTGLGTSIFSTQGNGVAWNGNLWVAVGSGTNTIATSPDGITWTGLGTSIFTGNGIGVAWNGNLWVAVGSGTNTIATSPDGITWTGRFDSNGTSIFSTQGNGVAWNGTLWVAVGEGTHTIATSPDGITWTGLSTSIFSTQGNGVAWNGTLWVAVGKGSGTNTIATSPDGITWTAVSNSNSIFSTQGNGVAWNGYRWVAVGNGSGTNTIATSPDGITWTAVSNSNSIFSSGYGVAWNGTLWVAVGNGSGTNAIATSPDGITWTGLGTSIFSTYGRGVAFNNARPQSITYPRNLTVAVGSGTNTIIYSTDGITWTPSNNSTSIFTVGYGVAWNGTLWVAVGQGTNTIATSPDGITWTAVSNSTSIFSTQCNGVAWNGSIFVAVGKGTNSIAYSYDGITWTGLGTSIFSSGNGVAWNGTLWAAVGEGSNTQAYSYDGISWIGIGSPVFAGVNAGVAIGQNIAWNGVYFLAVGGLSYLQGKSYDGINWIKNPNSDTPWSTGSPRAYGIASNGNIWVGTGTGKTIPHYSYDGFSWTTGVGSSFSSGSGKGVTWNGAYFIATGDKILVSPDGINWTTTFATNQGSSNAAAWNKNLPKVKIQQPVVAVGQGTNSIAYSTDGERWSGLGTSIFSTLGAGVAWNGNLWVAVGQGTNTIATSPDGITWTPRTNSLVGGNGVAWNGSMFVAVGSKNNNINLNDTIATSSDGITWNGRGSIFSTQGNGVAWNGYRWVAVGSGTNTIATSPDGINWTASSNGNSIFSNGNGVAWNGTLWVAVGDGTNTIAYSSDGINWTASSNGNSIFSTQGNGVAWNGTLWVAVGEGTHTIATSPDGITWTAVSNSTSIFSTQGNGVAWNGYRWVAVGNGSGTNTIATSPDGITWTAVSNSNSIFSSGNGVAGNPKIGATIVDSDIIINSNGINASNSLEFVTENYYQQGVNNISITLKTANK
jgi:hypothetical protein